MARASSRPRSCAALTLLHASQSLPLALLAGTLAATVAAVVVGYVTIRTQGVYFILLTLVFAQFAFELVFNGGAITGGLNGLASLSSAPIELPGLGTLDWSDPVAAYYLAVVAFLVAYCVARWIVTSSFGSTLAAVRDNQDRATYLGYDVAAIKRRAFVISGIFAGFAGVKAKDKETARKTAAKEFALRDGEERHLIIRPA